MANKVQPFREKTIPELQQLVKDWKAQLLALRFQHASGGAKEPHKFQELKVSIARALTIISEKQAAEGKEK